jgi:hypothetical protein
MARVARPRAREGAPKLLRGAEAGADPLDRRVLHEKVNSLLKSSRLAALVDDDRNAPRGLTKLLNRGKRRSPAYIPARAFALTVLDTFNPPRPAEGKPDEPPSQDAIAATLALAEKIEIESVRRVVVDALNEGRSNLEDIRKEVERSFDELMDRCSGW